VVELTPDSINETGTTQNNSNETHQIAWRVSAEMKNVQCTAAAAKYEAQRGEEGRHGRHEAPRQEPNTKDAPKPEQVISDLSDLECGAKPT